MRDSSSHVTRYSATTRPILRPGSSPTAPARGNRCGRGRSGAGTHANAHSASNGSSPAPGTSASASPSRATISAALSASLLVFSGPEWHAKLFQQRQRVIVTVRRRHDRDVHPVNHLDVVVVDLREHHLLLEPHGVV